MEIIALESVKVGKRDKTKAVTFKVTKGKAVQVYDFREKTTRVIFGPEQVMLAPYEVISTLNLSGGFPIQENKLISLSLELGPSFINDQFVIETTDHATLYLDLSFNWEFQIDKTNPEHVKKIFQNKDYIGNACKALSSRIRGVVSTETFDYFHKNSHMIIKQAVMKADKETGELKHFVMKENNFVITEINSRGYKPTDEGIENLLQRSFKISL
jgi:major vault protein